MVDGNLFMGVFWIVLGTIVLIPGYLIAIRGRADLHVHYDESVDPEYVSRRAGTTALLMGLAVVAYGVFHLRYGFHGSVFAGLLLALIGLNALTKRFAQGWGAE